MKVALRYRRMGGFGPALLSESYSLLSFLNICIGKKK